MKQVGTSEQRRERLKMLILPLAGPLSYLGHGQELHLGLLLNQGKLLVDITFAIVTQGRGAFESKGLGVTLLTFCSK